MELDIFAIYLKQGDNPFVSFQPTAIDYLSSHISFSHVEA